MAGTPVVIDVRMAGEREAAIAQIVDRDEDRWLALGAVVIGLAGWQYGRARRRRHAKEEPHADRLTAEEETVDAVFDGREPTNMAYGDVSWWGVSVQTEDSWDTDVSSAGESPAVDFVGRRAQAAVLDRTPSCLATLATPGGSELSRAKPISPALQTSSKSPLAPVASPSRSSGGKRGTGSRMARWWLVAWLLVAGSFVLFRSDADRAPNPASSSPQIRAHSLVTKPIEQIRLGDRVLGLNPQLDESLRSTPDPDPTTWRGVRLRMRRESGKAVQLELLPPASWLQANDATVGQAMMLDLSELGAVGPAEVLEIGSCQTIERGAGRVVTGMFSRQTDARIIDVYVEGLPTPVTCTENHYFWCETTKDFTAAGNLRIGDRVRTGDGSSRMVMRIAERSRSDRVYNIEVHVEHVHQVSSAGVLVHNQSAQEPPAPKVTGKRFSSEKQALVDMAKDAKRTGITKDDLEAFKQLNKGLPDPFPSNKVRGPETHSTRGAHSQEPHGHVGPVDHIPVTDA